jgi:putative transcriptional regulator
MNKGVKLKNRVKELRDSLNMRQSDLAREVDVTRQTILAIEKERLNPSIMVSLKLARVLHEPVGYVFYLEQVPEDVLQLVRPASSRSGQQEELQEPITVYEFT